MPEGLCGLASIDFNLNLSPAQGFSPGHLSVFSDKE
jgi:hypothetical protein